jgi:hypothetical protein
VDEVRFHTHEESAMADITLSLTAEERDLLAGLVQAALRETHVEARHTEFSVDYQDQVKRQEAALRSLLEKVRQAGA